MSLTDRLLYKVFKLERSYSQSGEDKILNLMFNSLGRSKITYLDIGTNHPVAINNTFLFYRKGGNGVCVEPNPEFASLIKKYRPRDTSLSIGIGVYDNVSADFYVMSSHVLSTFSKDEAYELDRAGKYTIKEVLSIPLKTINTIIKENFDQPIDLVSIDVEGWNEEIVDSFDFTKNRPFSFCVETITFAEDNSGKKLTRIIDRFLENDYSVYADTRINTIFVDNRLFSQ
jgi:FkbM family methyltransferase